MFAINTLLLAALAVAYRVAGSPVLKLQSCPSAVSLIGNPFLDRAFHGTKKYKSEVQEAAADINDPKAKALAFKVADTGTFLWLDSPSQLTTLEDELQDVPCSDILGIVLRNLPRRFCTAIESPPYQVDDYKSKFIDRAYSVSFIKVNASLIVNSTGCHSQEIPQHRYCSYLGTWCHSTSRSKSGSEWLPTRCCTDIGWHCIRHAFTQFTECNDVSRSWAWWSIRLEERHP